MSITPFLSQQRIDEMTAAGHWKNKTLLDHFDRHVNERPEHIAVVDHNSETGLRTVLSYRQLNTTVTRMALGLLKLGIHRGDVISCQLPNWWEFLAIHLAALRIGAVTNPMMPIFRHREVAYMMGFAETKIAIVPKSFRGFDYPAMMAEIKPELPQLAHTLVIGGPSNPDSFEEALLNTRWEDEMDAQVCLEGLAATPNEVVQLMYTSGTTGSPKGVMHTSNTLLSCTETFISSYHLNKDDNLYMGSPLAHQTGFLVGILIGMYLGSKVVYSDIWEASKALQIVQDEHITFTMGATPFVADMSYSPDVSKYDTRHFHTFVTGGAPIPRVVAEDARKALGCGVYGAYGMTESLIACICVPEDADDKIFNTDGSVRMGVKLRLVDSEGNEVAQGEEGEVQTAGPFNCCGYLKRKDLTDEAIDSQGWLSSGDLARKDEDGYIRISGRSKDIIIRGGENVPIVEVEQFLYKHPAIQECALVGMPDPRMGERGCLFVTLTPGSEFDENELQRYLGDAKMAKQYWPERLEIRSELPRTPSGKIQKFKLREEAKAFGEEGDGLAYG
ncbi:hypothetical protein A9Q88_07875 [Gammaproteobacteria bacterium 50_400_T64]|nr:hypothetical protein A9Q88_07875 [Gammaproteobacteria bacterium 50_400_T64]